MNTASDFIRHLLRRKKLRLKKDDIVTQKYQINSVVNLKTSKVDIEKENEKYIIKGAKVDIPQKSPIEIIKTRNLINVTKDEESIVKARVEEKVIQKLEEAINNNKKFEIKIEDINEKNIRTELSTLIKKDKEETKKIEEELSQINEKATPFNTLEDVKITAASRRTWCLICGKHCHTEIKGCVLLHVGQVTGRMIHHSGFAFDKVGRRGRPCYNAGGHGTVFCQRLPEA